jgi:ribosome-associated toxin RatA of RatAB toxin-antitoxin module
MAERTESSTTVLAPPADVLAIIRDFESYPTWTGAVKSAEVLSKDADGLPHQVRFVLDAGAIKDTYTLEYRWDVGPAGDGAVTWQLVEAGVLTSMDGSYTLSARGEGTLVTYRLAVAVRVPMIGMLKRKAERIIVDTALQELKKRAEG